MYKADDEEIDPAEKTGTDSETELIVRTHINAQVTTLQEMMLKEIEGVE